MNCTEVFNYIFESFNSNNIDYAIIHSYQYLPDRFDSDIDTAINVPIVIIPPEYRLAATLSSCLMIPWLELAGE